MDGRSAIVLRKSLLLDASARVGTYNSTTPLRCYRDHIQWLQQQDLSPEGYWRQLLKGFYSTHLW